MRSDSFYVPARSVLAGIPDSVDPSCGTVPKLVRYSRLICFVDCYRCVVYVVIKIIHDSNLPPGSVVVGVFQIGIADVSVRDVREVVAVDCNGSEPSYLPQGVYCFDHYGPTRIPRRVFQIVICVVIVGVVSHSFADGNRIEFANVAGAVNLLEHIAGHAKRE